MWILSCTASMGYLSRMTQWKVSCHNLDNRSFEIDWLLEQIVALKWCVAFRWEQQVEAEAWIVFLPRPPSCGYISPSVCLKSHSIYELNRWLCTSEQHTSPLAKTKVNTWNLPANASQISTTPTALGSSRPKLSCVRFHFPSTIIYPKSNIS
jgi:hypothetical protein